MKISQENQWFFLSCVVTNKINGIVINPEKETAFPRSIISLRI